MAVARIWIDPGKNRLFEGNNGVTQPPVVGVHSRWPYLAKERKLTLLAQKAQRAHRAIVRATNRPTRGKDARRLLATAIPPIICAFKQLHGNSSGSPPVRTTDLIHPAGQSSDIIISVPSPEHRVNASRNVIIGSDAPRPRRECVPSASRETSVTRRASCFSLVRAPELSVLLSERAGKLRAPRASRPRDMFPGRNYK